MIRPRPSSASRKWILSVLAVVGSVGVAACSRSHPGSKPAGHHAAAPAPVYASTKTAAPAVQAKSPVEAGRYLIVVGGCNDCHTPGYAMTGGKTPEMLWLTGNPVGFRGPWGTTYASNLRLALKDMKADDWVTIAKNRHDKPPMPWSQLHGMSEADLRSVYAYVKSLPVSGDATPAYLPPGREPQTPYVDMLPKNLPAGDGGAAAQ